MASPRARKSAKTASMPFLSMVRNAALVTRMRIQRFSLSTQKRRLVLLLACDTLLPDIGRLPVTLQTFAMMGLQTVILKMVKLVYGLNR